MKFFNREKEIAILQKIEEKASEKVAGLTSIPLKTIS
jgi:hypothetical protein